MEKEKKREAERLEKEKEREEKEKLRKEKERKKEEERLEKEKEREEKEKIRKEKEEEKRKKEEERRREMEEEEAKKEKAKQAFKSFFVKAASSARRSLGSADLPPEAACSEGQHCSGTDENLTVTSSRLAASGHGQSGGSIGPTKFKPFQLRKDMALAVSVPPSARARFDRKKLEGVLSCWKQREEKEDEEENNGSKENEDTSKCEMLYLEELKKSDYRPLKTTKSRTQKKDDEDVDCIVVSETTADDRESAVGGRMRAKLLQFVENYRPAYYGTWRKTCRRVTGRRPFSRYEEFDYSVDSDDEWEDVEGEVESIVGTDDEKDKEENVDDDYEEDEFFVPHGYLSESEEEESDDQVK